MRSNTLSDTVAVEDIADSGVAADGKAYRDTAPQFDWEYNKHLNKMKLYRTDAGGKMVLGKFDMRCNGVKLSMALGFNHVSAQQIKLLGASSNTTTSTELSVHYRELADTTGFYNDMPFARTTGSPHAIYSLNAVNMFANDSVYIHISNLPANAFTTLAQASTTVMAVIPMYSGSSSENFHTPSNPTSTNIGSMLVSELDVKMTDAAGALIDFNGVEHEFQLLFECFDKGTRSDKPPNANYMQLNTRNAFANIHPHAEQRHAAPRSTPTRHSASSSASKKPATMVQRPVFASS